MIRWPFPFSVGEAATAGMVGIGLFTVAILFHWFHSPSWPVVLSLYVFTVAGVELHRVSIWGVAFLAAGAGAWIVYGGVHPACLLLLLPVIPISWAAWECRSLDWADRRAATGSLEKDWDWRRVYWVDFADPEHVADRRKEAIWGIGILAVSPAFAGFHAGGWAGVGGVAAIYGVIGLGFYRNLLWTVPLTILAVPVAFWQLEDPILSIIYVFPAVPRGLS